MLITKWHLNLNIKRLLKSSGLPSISLSLLAMLAFLWRRARGTAPAVFICVSQGGKGSAADLRGHATARALGALGWNTLVIHPGLSAAQRRLLWEYLEPEVILLQQTRHPLNDPALYPGTPCLLDVDDADIIDIQQVNRIGAIATACHSVVAGSRYLAALFKRHNPHVSVIWTGTYLTHIEGAKPNIHRAPVLAWAPSDPFGYPAEAAFIGKIIAQLRSAPALTFRIYGVPAKQEGRAVALLGDSLPPNVAVKCMPPMPYELFVSSLAEVAVGLQPICLNDEYSLGKSFGKVLAYLAADVAVVASNKIDHPLFFRDGITGRLLEDDPATWATACMELLAVPEKRQQIVAAARQDFLARLTTDKAAHLLDRKLRAAISSDVVTEPVAGQRTKPSRMRQRGRA